MGIPLFRIRNVRVFFLKLFFALPNGNFNEAKQIIYRVYRLLQINKLFEFIGVEHPADKRFSALNQLRAYNLLPALGLDGGVD